MSLHSPWRRHANHAASPSGNGFADTSELSPLPDALRDLTEVAKKLVAYGGGAVSLDLALDLVLHEAVDQARRMTAADGAAIALMRDGEMVCRATTGENAPDLGVRVETRSGLAGACLASGQPQLCVDTELDGRVDSEACRRLNVRSLLVVPLAEQSQTFGILEVFSPRPGAFGDRDIQNLQALAARIAQNKREAEEGKTVSLGLNDHSPTVEERLSALQEAQPQETVDETEPDLPAQPANEFWASTLVVLVIAVAVILGVIIGLAWEGGGRAVPAKSNANPAKRAAPSPVPTPAKNAVPANAKAQGAAAGVGPGGLTITQNGKVIYRDQSPPSAESDGENAPLIHKVEPEYPADARERRIEGAVVLDVQVLSDGSVGEIATVSGDPILADAAVHAVKQWKYRPPLANGQPAQSQTRVTVRFTLPAN